MDEIITLMRPRLLSFRNRGPWGRTLRQRSGHVFLVLLGIVFWLGIFWGSHRVLSYFANIQELGGILAFKLMSVVVVTLLSLLVFSGLLVTLSKLYLSKDLLLVHAMPVPAYKIFVARWIESAVDSSWMVIVFALPMFAAYGLIFQGPWFYYGTVGAVLVLLGVTACAISAVVIMVAVIVVPASRIRTIFVFVGLSLFIAFYVGIRVIRPERLVDPEVFTATLFYLKSMQSPSSPFLPSTWAYDALVAALDGRMGGTCFHLGLLASFAGVLGFVMILVADAIYFKGVSRARRAPARLFTRRRLEFFWLSFLPGPVRALAVKEVKTFFRDQTQWSQLFLIAALIGIYIYNFKVIPFDRTPVKTIYLQNVLAFLNMGLALFVLTAVAGRFVFPGVSIEGEAFWIVRSSPVRLRQFLWVKYFLYLVPLLVLTLVLIVSTNILLHVGPFMMGLSLVNVCFMVPGVVSLGIGTGAAYADFKSENPAQTLTSYGGLIFMVLSAFFIGCVIIIEAGPVYSIFMARFQGRSLGGTDRFWCVFSFVLAGGLCTVTAILPMVLGEKRLTRRLFA
jgi:ABC-2 type transport system permease protein